MTHIKNQLCSPIKCWQNVNIFLYEKSLKSMHLLSFCKSNISLIAPFFLCKITTKATHSLLNFILNQSLLYKKTFFTPTVPDKGWIEVCIVAQTLDGIMQERTSFLFILLAVPLLTPFDYLSSSQHCRKQIPLFSSFTRCIDFQVFTSVSLVTFFLAMSSLALIYHHLFMNFFQLMETT